MPVCLTAVTETAVHVHLLDIDDNILFITPEVRYFLWEKGLGFFKRNLVQHQRYFILI